MNAFILAAPRSGSGKTTLSLALMRALGERVRPFKVGPDYIDPLFHEFCLKKPSYNLDLVMCGEENTQNTFYAHLDSDSIAVVEGVMGLFDGIKKEDESGYGSSAHLSLVLDIPVVLILDSRGISTSIAAVAEGFKNFKIFEKKVKLAGIILNRVSSSSVYDLLKDEIESNTDLEVLGYFPEDENLALSSRHLGLIPPEEVVEINRIIDRATEAAKECIDLEKILKKTRILPKEIKTRKTEKKFSGLKLAYAYDKAFNFYYRENLELLEDLGLELIPFSPLSDSALPEDIDILYLGGGFPEMFLEEIEKNETLRDEIKRRLDQGLYCYAECGGFIYLSDSIVFNGKTHRGVGFFENEIVMTDRLQNFGYCELEIGKLKVNAHEFHHTEEIKRENLPYAYRIKQRAKTRESGIIKKNTIAGYPHIHFMASRHGRELVERFLEKVKNEKKLC